MPQGKYIQLYLTISNCIYQSIILMLIFILFLQKYIQLTMQNVHNKFQQQYKIQLAKNINKMQKKKRVQHLSAVVDPHKVKVLILTDQKTIYQDFYFIMKFINIVKLDLSYNKIATFNVGFSFRDFTSLRILFLHYNRFSSLKSVQVVSESPALEYLTLFGNPLEETKTRHFFINSIPSLKLMDDKIITMQQRCPNIVTPQISGIVSLQFPIIPLKNSQGSTSFLSIVIQELRIIRQKYRQANPIISIQREFRKMLKKKNVSLQSSKSKSKFKVNINTQENVTNKLQTKINEQVQNLTVNKQRLITEKMKVHVSREQKIFSVLIMNMQFLAFLKEKSKKKVFALREFCDQEGIKYENTTKKLVCLKIPTVDAESEGRSHLQLLIKSCQKYLLRRKGSQQSMNIRKKYKILETILNKRRKRQPKFFSKILSFKPNLQLSKKIQKIQSSYENRFVLLREQPQKTYELLRQHFFSSLNSKKLFPFCLQEIVQRSAAAVSIQRMWKGYITRKKINSMQSITKDNCAWLIQRYVRNLGFRKRNTMLIQLTDYIKKQSNINQIILPMNDVLQLERIYKQVLTGINFILPDQKISFHINQQTSQVYLQRSEYIKFPSYLRNYVKDLQKSYVNKQCQNILDILFKGIKSVRYFTSNMFGKNPQKSRISSTNNKINAQKTLSLNRSTSALGNSGVIIIKSRQTFNKIDKKPEQIKNTVINGNNFVVLEYNSCTQATNRKFLLALLSYRIKTNKFLKSINLNINENSTNVIKDINQRINQQFIIYRINQQNSPTIPSVHRLSDRQQSNIMKIKLFISQDQLTIKIKCKFPYDSLNSKGNYKGQVTLSEEDVLNSRIGVDRKSQNHKQLRHSANISKNIIKFKPQQFSNQTNRNNFVSYREFEQKFHKRIRNRYEDLQPMDIKNKSLQKCQSLQPNTTRKQYVQNQNNFFTTNKNLQKNYITQVRNLNATQNLKIKLNTYDKNIAYSSIVTEQKQTKKKIITLMKQTHQQRLNSNYQFKKQELGRLRQKLNDQLQENKRIIQSNRLDGILANARKHNRVINALNRKAEDIKIFQKNFLKKGNSSMRKQLIKFQHDRSSSKSPDNQSISIYQSKKSLQYEQQHTIRDKPIKKTQKIANFKTQIKQFSIDENSDMEDLSLGAFQSENRSKQRHRRNCQKQKQQQERKRQKQIQKRQHRQYTERIANESKKKSLKKKKVVHSVFPQQFYPLKQTKRIGFELPKINKK